MEATLTFVVKRNDWISRFALKLARDSQSRKMDRNKSLKSTQVQTLLEIVDRSNLANSVRFRRGQKRSLQRGLAYRPSEGKKYVPG